MVLVMIKQLLNEEALNAYFDNDYSIALSVLKIFIDEILPETDTLLCTRNINEIIPIVHKIKPSFRMIGLASFAGSLESIEDSCGKGNFEVVKKMINDFLSKLNTARPYILDKFT